jgi:membrane protein
MPSTGRVPSAGRLRSRRAGGASRWRERTRRLVASAQSAHTRAENRFPVVTLLADRMVSVNIFDSATRLAAQSSPCRPRQVTGLVRVAGGPGQADT